MVKMTMTTVMIIIMLLMRMITIVMEDEEEELCYVVKYSGKIKHQHHLVITPSSS